MRTVKRRVLVLAMVLALAVVSSGAFFVWNGTRHTLEKDQAIALAENVYARSACKGFATTVNAPAFWGGEIWRVSVAGTCGLKTFVVVDATGWVRSETDAEVYERLYGRSMPTPTETSEEGYQRYRKELVPTPEGAR
ncbi:MAG: hypothetical protein HY531_01830 [Chloroflexi bacterium]|nr:hypothetical protein [Chloroflexota bacterium]